MASTRQPPSKKQLKKQAKAAEAAAKAAAVAATTKAVEILWPVPILPLKKKELKPAALGASAYQSEKNTASVVRCSFVGLGDNAEAMLKKPLFLVSVGGKYHEGDSLNSIISLFKNKHSGSKKVESFKGVAVLVAGSLQRYNFWNFSKMLNDKVLQRRFRDIPENLNAHGLAALIADKFYADAKIVEDNYIRTNALKFQQGIPRQTFHSTFIPWETVIPISASNTTKPAEGSFGRYAEYHARIVNAYHNNPEFAAAFKRTSERILVAKQDEIGEQLLRLVKITSRLSHFTEAMLNEVASLLSINYLLEECPLLFAELVDQGYTSIIYPGTLTEAFKVTQDLFAADNKHMPWAGIRHEDVIQKDDYGISTDIPERISPTSIRGLSILATSRAFSGSSYVITKSLSSSPTSSTSDPGVVRTAAGNYEVKGAGDQGRESPQSAQLLPSLDLNVELLPSQQTQSSPANKRLQKGLNVLVTKSSNAVFDASLDTTQVGSSSSSIPIHSGRPFGDSSKGEQKIVKGPHSLPSTYLLSESNSDPSNISSQATAAAGISLINPLVRTLYNNPNNTGTIYSSITAVSTTEVNTNENCIAPNPNR